MGNYVYLVNRTVKQLSIYLIQRYVRIFCDFYGSTNSKCFQYSERRCFDHAASESTKTLGKYQHQLIFPLKSVSLVENSTNCPGIHGDNSATHSLDGPCHIDPEFFYDIHKDSTTISLAFSYFPEISCFSLDSIRIFVHRSCLIEQIVFFSPEERHEFHCSVSGHQGLLSRIADVPTKPYWQSYRILCDHRFPFLMWEVIDVVSDPLATVPELQQKSNTRMLR